MKLAHYRFDYPLEFTAEAMLVVENKKQYYDFIVELCAQVDGEIGGFELFDQMNLIKFESIADIIIDYVNLEINSKKALSKLYKELVQIAVSDEHYMQTEKLMLTIKTTLERLIFESDILLKYEEVELEDIFKGANLSFDLGQESLLEKLVAYTDTMAKYCGKRMFFFVNLFAYCSVAQIIELIKHCNYINVNILFIEPVVPANSLGLVKNIIDDDLVQIVDK